MKQKKEYKYIKKSETISIRVTPTQKAMVQLNKGQFAKEVRALIDKFINDYK